LREELDRERAQRLQLEERVAELEHALSDRERDLKRLKNHLQEIQNEHDLQIEELRNAQLAEALSKGSQSPQVPTVSNAELESELQVLQNAAEQMQEEKEEEIEIRTFHLQKQVNELTSQLRKLQDSDLENTRMRKELSELKMATLP